MGTIARSAAPSTTAAKRVSKVGRGTTSIPSPRASRAASWLNAPRSPWIATLSFGPVIAGMLPSWRVNSKQRTARGGGFTPPEQQVTGGERSAIDSRGASGGSTGGATQHPPCRMNASVRGLVRKGGFEPPRPFGHTVLSRARLPFRHFRVGAALRLQVYPVLSLWVASTPGRPPLDGRVHRGDVGPQGARLRDRGRGPG